MSTALYFEVILAVLVSSALRVLRKYHHPFYEMRVCFNKHRRQQMRVDLRQRLLLLTVPLCLGTMGRSRRTPRALKGRQKPPQKRRFITRLAALLNVGGEAWKHHEYSLYLMDNFCPSLGKRWPLSIHP